MTNKLFKVEVVEIETGKIVATIGHGLSAAAAERRVMTGLSRYNPDKVLVRDVPETPEQHCGRSKAGTVCHDSCPLKQEAKNG